MESPPSLGSGNLREAVAGLLASGGVRGGFTMRQLRGGANNRVYRVKAGGADLLLKAYFQHPDDPRDRLRAEFGFSSFAWGHGVRALPRPVACDPERGLGLYEFVAGRPLRPSQVDAEAVRQALDFYHAINRRKDEAAALPRASEGCLALSDYIEGVERRLRRLRAVDGPAGVDRKTAGFIRGELSEAWSRAADRVRRRARKTGLEMKAELAAEERCLSPSDFGFHNALVVRGGRIVFIDFEYSGWDDPAKMICDFFCQQKVPVPHAFYEPFARGAASIIPGPQRCLARADLVMPVCALKWVCILLNDFVPCGSERRRFARIRPTDTGRKSSQLDKARTLLASLRSRLDQEG